MNYFIYVLLSKKDSQFYIGYTKDLRKRYEEHTSRQVPSTKFRLPLKLLHYKAFKMLNQEKYFSKVELDINN